MMGIQVLGAPPPPPGDLNADFPLPSFISRPRLSSSARSLSCCFWFSLSFLICSPERWLPPPVLSWPEFWRDLPLSCLSRPRSLSFSASMNCSWYWRMILSLCSMICLFSCSYTWLFSALPDPLDLSELSPG